MCDRKQTNSLLYDLGERDLTWQRSTSSNFTVGGIRQAKQKGDDKRIKALTNYTKKTGGGQGLSVGTMGDKKNDVFKKKSRSE